MQAALCAVCDATSHPRRGKKRRIGNSIIPLPAAQSFLFFVYHTHGCFLQRDVRVVVFVPSSPPPISYATKSAPLPSPPPSFSATTDVRSHAPPSPSSATSKDLGRGFHQLATPRKLHLRSVCCSFGKLCSTFRCATGRRRILPPPPPLSATTSACLSRKPRPFPPFHPHEGDGEEEDARVGKEGNPPFLLLSTLFAALLGLMGGRGGCCGERVCVSLSLKRERRRKLS